MSIVSDRSGHGGWKEGLEVGWRGLFGDWFKEKTCVKSPGPCPRGKCLKYILNKKYDLLLFIIEAYIHTLVSWKRSKDYESIVSRSIKTTSILILQMEMHLKKKQIKPMWFKLKRQYQDCNKAATNDVATWGLTLWLLIN